MRLCEICSTPLRVGSRQQQPQQQSGLAAARRPANADPVSTSGAVSRATTPAPGTEAIKISFRKGGEKVWYAALKKTLMGKAWDGSPLDRQPRSAGSPSRTSNVHSGIHGIMQAAESTARAETETLSVSLRDLEALMAKAKQMVQIAQTLNEKLSAQEDAQRALSPSSPPSSSSTAVPEEATFIRSSMARLGLPSVAVTQDMVKDEKEYIDGLARELAALLPPSTLISVIPLLYLYTSPPIHQRTFKQSGLSVLHVPKYAHDAFTTRFLYLISDPEAGGTGLGALSSVEVAREEGMSVGLVEEMIGAVEDDGEVLRDEPGKTPLGLFSPITSFPLHSTAPPLMATITHEPLPPNDVLSHVIDAHCHPTDNEIPASVMDDLKTHICAMASRQDDQVRVADLARQWPDKVTPCFGFHPWNSHHISLLDTPPSKRDHYTSLFFSESPSAEDTKVFEELLQNLPDPVPISSILASVRGHLTEFPNALLGEVGIDRSFRVPIVPYPFAGAKKLSPFTVPTRHQLAVLEAQIALAIEFRRSISLHSVKAQQVTLDMLKKLKDQYGEDFGKVNIDLHSCGFSAETWKEVESKYPNIFLSLSIVINGRSPAHEVLIRKCSPDRILSESDFNNIDNSTQHTWDMVCAIARIKNWAIESEAWDDEDGLGEEDWGVVRRLERNWRRFIGPGLGVALNATRAGRKTRHLNDPAHKWRGEWVDESSDGEETDQKQISTSKTTKSSTQRRPDRLDCGVEKLAVVARLDERAALAFAKTAEELDDGAKEVDAVASEPRLFNDGKVLAGASGCRPLRFVGDDDGDDHTLPCSSAPVSRSKFDDDFLRGLGLGTANCCSLLATGDDNMGAYRPFGVSAEGGSLKVTLIALLVSYSESEPSACTTSLPLPFGSMLRPSVVLERLPPTRSIDRPTEESLSYAACLEGID
ncbi:hypothetical protein FRB90_005781, partial [Tulasnella sp. 427]